MSIHLIPSALHVPQVAKASSLSPRAKGKLPAAAPDVTPVVEQRAAAGVESAGQDDSDAEDSDDEESAALVHLF